MEKNLNDQLQPSELSQIEAAFLCEQQDVRALSPLTLAYIGDCIYDQIIRSVVVRRGNRPANHLHRMTIRYVNAAAQARMIEALEEKDLLTEEEMAIYKRGRNAKSHTSAKNASIEDYRKATGFEALVGFLYLQDRFPRILELVTAAMEILKITI